MEMVKEISSDVVEIIEPAKEGYQLTLRLDIAKIVNSKGLVGISFQSPTLYIKSF